MNELGRVTLLSPTPEFFRREAGNHQETKPAVRLAVPPDARNGVGLGNAVMHHHAPFDAKTGGQVAVRILDKPPNTLS